MVADNEARHPSARVSERHHTAMNTQQSDPQLPPINKRAHTITRFILRQLERNLGVQIRVHGLTTPFARGGGIVVANHFTRLETFVIPFVLYREVQIIVRVLAAPMLFTNNAFGEYLAGVGALSTNYPNKYELIARDILRGGWWLIFPEGSMIKDRKVIERGRLLVSNEGGTLDARPIPEQPSLRSRCNAIKTRCGTPYGTEHSAEQICQSLGLPHLRRTDLEAMLQRPTSILPLSMTYYPLHPQENLLKSLVTRLVPTLMHSDMGPRLVEELTVEGAMLLKAWRSTCVSGNPGTSGRVRVGAMTGGVSMGNTVATGAACASARRHQRNGMPTGSTSGPAGMGEDNAVGPDTDATYVRTISSSPR